MKPGPDELAAARAKTVPDLLVPDLRVVFVGINPGLWSAAVGQHFARPGNRFWTVLHRAGFTDRPLHPSEQTSLLSLGIGITNLVDRATAAASELTRAELSAGAERLAAKVARLRPGWVAFVGMQAYRQALRRPRAGIGPQPEPFGGTSAWLLPNPSGLQARYQLPELVDLYAALHQAAFTPNRSIPSWR